MNKVARWLLYSTIGGGLTGLLCVMAFFWLAALFLPPLQREMPYVAAIVVAAIASAIAVGAVMAGLTIIGGRRD